MIGDEIENGRVNLTELRNNESMKTRLDEAGR